MRVQVSMEISRCGCTIDARKADGACEPDDIEGKRIASMLVDGTLFLTDIQMLDKLS